MRKKTAFVWTAECEAEFLKIKEILTDEGFIKPFNSDLDTKLLVDTPKVAGARYILIQRAKDGTVHIVRC